jgi:ferrochelatase
MTASEAIPIREKNAENNDYGVLLINLGTPDEPTPGAVARYLREFLSDRRVIDINPIGRFFLVNFAIIPFRKGKSARAYKKIWKDEGSPLTLNGQSLAERLEAELNRPCVLAMRYQNPSVQSALDHLIERGVDRIIVIPLFPQYASASWGSAVEHIYAVAGKNWNTPSLNVIDAYYGHEAYIEALAAIARPILEDMRPDKVLMSFHGLPERQCSKCDTTGKHCLKIANCCDQIVEANRHCYRAQSFETSRRLAAALKLSETEYEVAFQSRLGKRPWIKPFTDYRIKELPEEGVKRLAVICPSFAADCLETLEEIEMDAVEDFKEVGGEELRLVPCLNDHPAWVAGLAQMIRDMERSS